MTEPQQLNLIDVEATPATPRLATWLAPTELANKMQEAVTVMEDAVAMAEAVAKREDFFCVRHSVKDLVQGYGSLSEQLANLKRMQAKFRTTLRDRDEYRKHGGSNTR